MNLKKAALSVVFYLLLTGLILLMLLIGRSVESGKLQDDNPKPGSAQTHSEDAVQKRPIEAEFMMIVSYCVDAAIWQDNTPTRYPTGDRAAESPLHVYLLNMRTCLLKAETEWTKHTPKEQSPDPSK